MIRPPPRSSPFPYTTLFRSLHSGDTRFDRSLTVLLLGVPFGQLLISAVRDVAAHVTGVVRSEEHTSELQSQSNLVCRLLLEKKKKKRSITCLRRSMRYYPLH